MCEVGVLLLSREEEAEAVILILQFQARPLGCIWNRSI